jgi:hypothetical protein
MKRLEKKGYRPLISPYFIKKYILATIATLGDVRYLLEEHGTGQTSHKDVKQ